MLFMRKEQTAKWCVNAVMGKYSLEQIFFGIDGKSPKCRKENSGRLYGKMSSVYRLCVKIMISQGQFV